MSETATKRKGKVGFNRRKIEPILISSSGKIDPDMTVNEIIREFKIAEINYSLMRHMVGGHAKFLHFLSSIKENKQVKSSFVEKWRWAIGSIIWERYARKNNIFVDNSSSLKRDYIYAIKESDLFWEICFVRNHPFLGTLTLPEGETIHLPVIKSNVSIKKTGVNIKSLKKLYWWAKSVDERISRGNIITPLIDGEETFRHIYRAMISAQHYIFISAWALDLNFPLIRVLDYKKSMRTTLNGIFKELASSKRKHVVQIYILLWDGNFVTQGPSVSEGEIAETIGLAPSKNVHFVLDSPPTMIDSHHQKTVVVDGKIAFCGGFDFSFMFYDRWDTQEHKLQDPKRNLQHNFWVDWLISRELVGLLAPDGGWHDMHVRIEGPDAFWVDKNFRERWDLARNGKPWRSDVDDERPEGAKKDEEEETDWPVLPFVPGAPNPSTGPHTAQVIRTMPDSDEQSVKEIYLQAIKNARRYIYIENQYLNDPEIKDALRDAIISANVRKDLFGDEFRLVVVLPVHYEEMADTADPAIYLGGVFSSKTEVEKWQEVAEAIRSVDDHDMFGLYFLANGVRTGISDGGEEKIYAHPIYIHAKMMIVDDIWFTIGSTNTGTRSFERDTEINVAAMNTDVQSLRELDLARSKNPGSSTAARDFRLRLWREHLEIATEDIDPIAGADLWWNYAVHNLNDPGNAKGRVFFLNDEMKGKLDFMVSPPYRPVYELDEHFKADLDASAALSLAKMYAPVFHFHKDDKYRPISVDAVLKHSDLEWIAWYGYKKIETGGITAETLEKNNKRRFQIDIENAKKITSKLQTPANQVVYYRAFKQVKHGKAHIVLQYWLFFLDSLGEVTGPDSVTHHDGDWEFLQIVFDENKPPLSIGCSIHYYGEAREWQDGVEKISTHPKIYVTKGGHGCHFSKGRFPTYMGMENKFSKSDWLGVKGGFDETGDDDIWVNPEDYQLENISNKKWAKWKGHFGKVRVLGRQAGLPGGPRSPYYRSPDGDSDNSKLSMWNYPITWQEEFLKPEYRNYGVLTDKDLKPKLQPQ